MAHSIAGSSSTGIWSSQCGMEAPRAARRKLVMVKGALDLTSCALTLRLRWWGEGQVQKRVVMGGERGEARRSAGKDIS